MLHVHRHINALREFRPVVLSQKEKGSWSGIRPNIIPRSPLREIGRLRERITGLPWQLSVAEARAMTAVLEKNSCRLLHLFFGDAAVHCLPLADAFGGPLVISFHGADVAGAFAGPAYRGTRERLFARAARVGCRSSELLERVAELGCPGEKLCLMRTILPGLPDSPHKSPPSEGGWRILQAGRLIPKKGTLTALLAFARFREEYPLATFTLVGEGPMRPTLEAEVVRLGLGNSVRMPGFLSQEALLEEYAAAHIYLHPSETDHGDREGVPNALLEAMACRLPPVATRHGGIPEAIEDGVSGLLCEEADSAGLSRALLALAGDPGLYQKTSEAAREKVLRDFSPEEGIRAVEAIYRQAMVCAC